jgi:UDP-N-acetylglucosamine 1-carboxyvinyltransferase
VDKLKIRGGRKLNGSVRISGAKNAALPALAACLLTEESIHLHNVPQVRDVRTMVRVLEHLGAQATAHDDASYEVRVIRQAEPEAPYDLVKTMRASVLTLGPLLARFGAARVSLPGGCAIGERPIDWHLEALRRLGADVDLSHGYVSARAGRLVGATVNFPQPTVTGTENIMMAATLASGTSTLNGCAREPEIIDLATLLRAMGARITGDGTSMMTIEGVDALSGAEHTVVPDRIEAATFIIAGILAGESVAVERCEPKHLDALLQALGDAGARVKATEDSVTVEGGVPLKPVNLSTAPYPGFPTDMQAQFMTAMTQAEGTCSIIENIFENRFMHVGELRRMGARISHEGRKATIQGATPLSGAQVMATDLRASASLVIAALIAEGTTVIDRVYHLDRGYERIEHKLQNLGGETNARKGQSRRYAGRVGPRLPAGRSGTLEEAEDCFP